MCYTHGKLIDTDESRFSIEVLRGWKRLAELRARISLELGHSVELEPSLLQSTSFPEEVQHIESLGSENRQIGNLLLDCCVKQIWGQDVMEALRDLLIEITRNSIYHGGASHVTIAVEPRRVVFLDNGALFDPRQLSRLESNTGGAASMSHLLKAFAERMIVEYARAENENTLCFSLPSTIEDVAALSPCALQISQEDLRNSTYSFQTFKDCDTLYVIPPQFFTISDIVMLGTALGFWTGRGRNVVIVTDHASGLVQTFLVDRIPNCRVMILPNPPNH